jgi:tetrapyrrole methylase family protein/MazG family protein
MAKVIIAGLGPAGPEFITHEVRDLINGDAPVFLRTERHPAAAVVSNATTFDHVYDSAETIEEVYATIVERLVAAAQEHGEVVYLVPGSPLIAESAVVQLRADSRVQTDIRPSLSFLDLTWHRLGVDPLAVSPRLVDGYRFANEAAGERGPLLVGQCDNAMVLSDIKLSFEDNEPEDVVVLQRLGLPDENVQTVAWEDLDRAFEPDHLTSIWIPELSAPVASELIRVDEVARRLRVDCPWDAKQTHQSLAKHALEETYELLEAIEDHQRAGGESDRADEHLIEELGDVLFQVFAHSAIAAEQGRFNVSDVARSVSDKLISRHPHVYGNVEAETADDVLATWESNKMAEKGRTSVMEGIPRTLPALAYAQKILKRAASVGVEIENDSLAGVQLDGRGAGAALLMMVDEARKRGVDAEDALRQIADEVRKAYDSPENPESAPRAL